MHGASRWLDDNAERDSLAELVKLLGGYPLPMAVVLPILATTAPSEVLDDLRTGDTSADPAGVITRAIEYSHGKLDPALQAALLLLAPFTTSSRPSQRLISTRTFCCRRAASKP